MKIFIILLLSQVVFALLVGVAVAQLAAPSAPGAGGLAGAAGGAAGGRNTGNPWGPKAYGMGLNNPWAFPPNPFMMRRALALVNSVPGSLVVSIISYFILYSE